MSLRKVEIIALEGMPEVRPGDDLAGLIETTIRSAGIILEDGDILVVSQKVVSKAEGRILRAEDVRPSVFAQQLSRAVGKGAEHLEVILRNTARIVRTDLERGIFIMETPHGFICANAGVDRSNVGVEEAYTALPGDPDRSAKELRRRLESAFSVSLAVIVSDTFGRPWRRGQTDVAIGVSGMMPLKDYRGTKDRFGHELRATVIAVADEVAAAAELVKGKADGVPVAIVRGLAYERSRGSVRDLLRDKEEDLFR
jgi:coenzyme F420-0:L-glutamate ligase/coenzyme F420-1:gamma-L-glutamate ligase